MAGRTTWYTTVEEIQAHVDRCLASYNLERPHSGSRLQGWTPAQAFCETVGLDGLPGLGEERAPDALAA